MILMHQIFGLLSLLLLLASCMLLHIRLRHPSSLSFLFSLAAFIAWSMWGESILWQITPTPPSTGTAKDIIYFARSQAIVAAIEGIFMLWISCSLFFAIKAIRPLARHAA